MLAKKLFPNQFRKMVSVSVVNVLLVASTVVFVGAQIPSLGWCPDYLPMADFDMERFLGKWYEAERYFAISEVASRCVVTDYARSPNGRIYISNEVTNRLTGVKRVIGGHLELVGKGNEGKMNVKYATTPISTESTLIVLDTDYDNYAVIWNCNSLGPINAQNAWLMTRERLPAGNILQHAYGVLDQFKISRTFFVKTDQEGCAIVAADINAANGITLESTVPQATGSEQKVGINKKPEREFTEEEGELKGNVKSVGKEQQQPQTLIKDAIPAGDPEKTQTQDIKESH